MQIYAPPPEENRWNLLVLGVVWTVIVVIWLVVWSAGWR